MKPICFMVMPFGVKDVPNAPAGAPSKIDFDSLWSLAFKPAIAGLGYEAVRADQDSNSLIIHEMLERLYFADLVLADMTIPNGNVYYEIGVRHAAKQTGCVLLAADWAAPLFDVQQMRRIAYPLSEQVVSEMSARAIGDILSAQVSPLSSGDSPVFTVLPGYPNPSSDRALTMRDELLAYSDFLEEVRAVRLYADRAKAKQIAQEIADRYPATSQLKESVALPIMHLIRDNIGWQEVLAYIQALPDALRNLPAVKELFALAQSNSGDHEAAIAGLETLIRLQGDSSERRGLIGGRYKRLEKAAASDGNDTSSKRALGRAIESYEKGMRLELGNYYCVSNLARLYRMRNSPGDEVRALFAQQLTTLMANNAINTNRADEWTRPTLLGAAFDSEDEDTARAALAAIQNEGAAKWQLESTIADLEQSVAQITNSISKERFETLLLRMRELL